MRVVRREQPSPTGLRSNGTTSHSLTAKIRCGQAVEVIVPPSRAGEGRALPSSQSPCCYLFSTSTSLVMDTGFHAMNWTRNQAVNCLRDNTAQQLGVDFDLRRFHDLILAEDALPMDLLQEQVEACLAERKTSSR